MSSKAACPSWATAFAALLTMAPATTWAQAGVPYLAPADDDDSDVKPKPEPKPQPLKPPGPEGPAPAPETTAPVESTSVAPPFTFVPSQGVIEKLWDARHQALVGNNLPEAERLLKELLAAKEQAGWPNAFAYGEALVRESEQALTRGNAMRGVDLAQAAVLLAPNLPSTHLALARATWSQGGGLLSAISAYADGYLLTWTEAPFFRARLGAMLTTLCAVIFLAAAAFALMMLYRHLRLMLHDLHHLLPRGATRAQSGFLGVVVLCMPFFFRLGWATILLVWILLLGFYYRSRERVAAILVLALLAVLPVVLPWATSFSVCAGGRSETIYLAARDMLARDAVERLEAIVEPKTEELYVLGLRAKWNGDLHRAVDLLTRAERAGTADPLLFTQLGSLKFQLQDKPAAIGYYNRALGVDPNNVVALFNLSRVYYSLAEQQKAGEAHRKATSIDYERVEGFAREAKRFGANYLVPTVVPASLLRVPQQPDSLHARAVEQVWLALSSHCMPRYYFAAAAFLGLVIIAMMALLRRFASPSVTCPRCGTPACQRCSPEMPDKAQCGQCYHAFVAKEALDPQARIHKEIEVHRYEARSTRIRQALSLLVAGTSQLSGGSALKGLGLFASFMAGGLGVLITLDIIPTPAPLSSRALSWPTVVVLGLMTVAAYAFGLVDAQRKDR